ncbi:hypothetical protein [Candidatus Neptunochlamydia vexilliferae]|uniref:Uncharacterized protein n=1 Tax=Candidatus Neptunichlamydia vexilliferae TaxID=1651774 RepID=A0ABS0B0J8_9BACT|nr:hypothetical protein [Candidatus Neptunochlamydia vexilliferae]MBF5059914.1 hypothetical protein [Candidatus Neptunochlamydia vexilliferae]
MEIEGLSEEYAEYVNYEESSWNGHSVQPLGSEAGVGIVPTAASGTSESDDSSNDHDADSDSSGSWSRDASVNIGVGTDGSARIDVGVGATNESGTVSGSIHGEVSRDRGGRVDGRVEAGGVIHW